LRKVHLALLPALLLALALGLAACGGGGESDEDKITSIIEESATSTDPSICKETQTQAFMEQSSSASGGAAVKECEEETKSGESNPDSVNVSEVEADNGKATADVAFEGGAFDKQTVEVALVEENGKWKLDELTGFAKFDPSAFVGELAEQLEEEPEIEPQVAGCIVEGLEEAPKEELEALVIENNTQPVVELAESCE
jgi:ABC-type glycerol-3-phosphate transport system substrate-binding protein